jgi:hypothetical protein
MIWPSDLIWQVDYHFLMSAKQWENLLPSTKFSKFAPLIFFTVNHVLIIWNRHGLECSRIWKLFGNFIKKCWDFLGRDILGTTFFRAESSLIQSSCRSFIPEVSYPLSYVRYHWNPEPMCNKSHFASLFYLYWYFLID